MKHKTKLKDLPDRHLLRKVFLNPILSGGGGGGGDFPPMYVIQDQRQTTNIDTKSY